MRQLYNAKGIIVDQCIEDYGSGTVSIKAGRYYVSVLIEISINRQELRNWKRNCVENKDASDDFVSRFVRQKAKGTGLSEEGILYITSFYSYAIVGITMQWVENGMPEYRKNLLKTVSETYEATIDVMINDYISHNIK